MRRLLKWFFSGSVVRILLVLAVLAGMLAGFPLLSALDNVLFERLVALKPLARSQRVAVVAIDRTSIDHVGNWPWPRTYLAEAVSLLSRQGADAVGLHLLLPDAEWNPGLAGLRSLQRRLNLDPQQTLIGRSLVEMQTSIDGDARLATALAASAPSVVPFLFVGPDLAAPDEGRPLPTGLAGHEPGANWREDLVKLRNPLRNWCVREEPTAILTSYPALSAAADRQGHINYRSDLANRVRQVPLLNPFRDRLYPALVLQLAAVADGAENPSLRFADETLFVNDRPVETGADFDVYVNPLTEKTIERYSFSDVVNDNVPAEAFRGRVVLLGLTTTALSPGGIVRVDEPPAVVSAAAVVSDLLAGRTIVRPAWAFLLEAAVLLWLGVFLVLVLPRLHPGLGWLLLAIFFFSWIVAVGALLALKGMWFQLAPHLVLAASGLLLISLQRALARPTQNYDDLKMLGLSFQSQGMLDLAFDKFRQCPVGDKSIREILYNLGLDFERKRMFNKAIAVYTHLLRGGRFKDAKKKIAELKEMESSVVIGGGRDGTLILGKGTLPTLGRYEVVRELGQGAMGTVYLGRDPKINRDVAIKTLNLHDVEPDQVPEVKERFFREAEAAGRLNHPNIVTIYDAGEEHDLAYMAMEYLVGRDLTAHCGPDRLLPPSDVMTIAAEVADALAYAHANDVVHRDIKPSNLMRLESGKIKVTDFGIARVVNASQTQTGTILGTPSYMSPEQVSGDRVKGASDLFSLGIVCYELLSGQKPFVGDSLGALMHNIANVKYAPLKRVRPDLPECCYAVVRKLLKKELRDRYRTADEVAEAWRKCIAKAG